MLITTKFVFILNTACGIPTNILIANLIFPLVCLKHMSKLTCKKWKSWHLSSKTILFRFDHIIINSIAQVKSFGIILHSLLSLSHSILICSNLVNSLNSSLFLNLYCNQPSQRDHHFICVLWTSKSLHSSLALLQLIFTYLLK